MITPGMRRALLTLLLAAGVVEVFRRSLIDVAAGSASYLLTVSVMAAVGVVGIALRRDKVLPIHDREVDWIIGLLAILMAVSVDVLLLPRLVEWLYLLRLDVLAVVIFAFGAVTLLLGSRTALRYGPVWLVLFLFNAPVYLVVSLMAGGGWTGSAAATVVGVTVMTAVVVDGTERRRLAVVGTCALTGAALTVLVVLPVA